MVQDMCKLSDSKILFMLLQRVQKWSIVPVDFSVPGGELGPTLKLKRHYVLKKYDTQINNFYNV